MWKGSEPRQPGTPAGEDRSQHGEDGLLSSKSHSSPPHDSDAGGRDRGERDRGSGKYAPPSPAWPLQHPPVGQTPDAVLSELEVSAVKK
ncbi:unnamed protein product, partial [Ectocarpus sp. 12 AP-2014]